MARKHLIALVPVFLLVIPACGEEDADTDSETTTVTDTSGPTTGDGDGDGDGDGAGDGEEPCTMQTISIAAGTDVVGGTRPCGIGFGAAAAAEAAALAQCGGNACFTQVSAPDAYCGVMAMSPDGQQFWPGTTTECNSTALEEMMLSQCKTASGGVDCEIKCSLCGTG